MARKFSASLAALGIAIVAVPHACAVEVWVAPGGKDSNSGLRGSPLATLDAALATPGVSRILVQPGTFALSRPIRLGVRHQGLVIEAAQAGRPPVFSGAYTLKPGRIDASGWQVPATTGVDQLWVNGRRAVPARHPNTGWLFSAGRALSRSAPPGSTVSRSAFRLKPEEAALLSSLPADTLDRVRVRAWHAWSVSEHGIERFDAATGILTLKGASQWPFFHFGANQRFQLINVPSALDAAGEWTQAADHTIHYRPHPGESLRTAVVQAGVAGMLLLAEDVENVTLRNLSFRHTKLDMPASGIPGLQAAAEAGAALEFRNARGARLENLRVTGTAQYAIWFRGDCEGATLQGSVMEDLGAGGVRIGETDAKPLSARDGGVSLLRNVIRDGGKVFPGAAGILVGHAGRNRIVGNEIADMGYTGISLGWRWGYGASMATHNLVEANHIHRLGRGELSDLGGIYTLGPSPGTVIRGNEIHDLESYDQYGRGAWGIYLDEGSSDIRVEGNLVYRTASGGFHQHYGRDNVVTGNIFAFGRDAQLQRSRVEGHSSFTFERNIILADGTPIFHGNWADGKFAFRDNIVFDLTRETPEWGREASPPGATGGVSGARVTDPGFVDPRRGDFGFRATSRLQDIPSWRRPELAPRSVWETPPPKRSAIREPRPPPLQWRDSFDDTPAGAAPELARVSVEGKGDRVAISAGPSRSGHQSLLLEDVAGLTHAHDPHLFYRPHHAGGVTTVRFSLWLDEGAEFLHEWRDAALPYRTGPVLAARQGRLFTDDKPLGTLAPRQWIDIEITCGLGADSTGTWRLRVKAAEGGERSYELPFRHRDWRTLDWLGFVSNGKVPASTRLDELAIGSR